MHQRELVDREDGTAVLTMLYVEDQPSDVLLITRLLERLGGVDLHVASTGTQGLQVAAELRPDVVVLDLHLPDLSGETVLQRLRSEPDLGATPVLVLTADASPATTQRLRAAGVIAYLTKPLEVSVFFTHLAALESRAPVRATLTRSSA